VYVISNVAVYDISNVAVYDISDVKQSDTCELRSQWCLTSGNHTDTWIYFLTKDRPGKQKLIHFCL
jgi:hypothetical protein